MDSPSCTTSGGGGSQDEQQQSDTQGGQIQATPPAQPQETMDVMGGASTSIGVGGEGGD